MLTHTVVVGHNYHSELYLQRNAFFFVCSAKRTKSEKQNLSQSDLQSLRLISLKEPHQSVCEKHVSKTALSAGLGFFLPLY